MDIIKERNNEFERENVLPVRIIRSEGVSDAENLLIYKEPSISFRTDGFTLFEKKGAYAVLDFGKELCGSLRLVVRAASGMADFRITFGESVSEACSDIGEKNATNDHATRDFVISVPSMSDGVYGLSGFRFARLELISEGSALIECIYAYSVLPHFAKEARIETDDELLNKIIETAAYTIKLNYQNGYIWDGIKRDRLVWSGDLHQEIITGMYLFGDNANIRNSLDFLRKSYPNGAWINNMPCYSAWWVLNFCDYCELSGDKEYFEAGADYAEGILDQFATFVDENGEMHLESYFLDWPSNGTPEAIPGTAAVIILAAKRFLGFRDCAAAKELIEKLTHYLYVPVSLKQVRAFQILAGAPANADGAAFLEKDGAHGFSTFMAYYILKADALCGGTRMLQMIKEYFGAMLSRGATSFWEDFDLDWLEGSGRIDCLPKEGERDLHGDYGNYCYVGLRHSLCHGWSSGLVSFIVEYVLGLCIKDGKLAGTDPHPLGLGRLYAEIPLRHGLLCAELKDGKLKYEIKS